jgi:hypothetical protein
LIFSGTYGRKNQNLQQNGKFSLRHRGLHKFFYTIKIGKKRDTPVGYAGKGTVARGFGGGRLDMPAAKKHG